MYETTATPSDGAEKAGVAITSEWFTSSESLVEPTVDCPVLSFIAHADLPTLKTVYSKCIGAPGAKLRNALLEEILHAYRKANSPNKADAHRNAFAILDDAFGTGLAKVIETERCQAIITGAARAAVLEMNRPQEILIEMKGKSERIEVGRQHKAFETMVRLLSTGLNVYLYGPAGTGKTEAARAAARAFEKTFCPYSLGPQTMRSEIFGYMDAAGNYVSTEFRKAYEGGGLILLDELDRCNPRVSVALNSAIENNIAAFPDAMVQRSPETLVIGAGNTRMHGADVKYVTATQQDAAFMDRFAFLEWDLDVEFERELLSSILGGERLEVWLKIIQSIRGAIKTKELRYGLSMRRALQGAKMVKAGFNGKQIESSILFAGWSDDDVVRATSDLSFNFELAAEIKSRKE